MLQDWLYEEGEDTTKAVYTNKIEEIRSLAGPIVQRYNDKLQEELLAKREAQEKIASAKRAEQDAKKKTEEKKKEPEPEKPAAEAKDAEMADAEKPAEFEEKVE